MLRSAQSSFDWGEHGAPLSVAAKIAARSGTFTDNMKLPVHRWFRYSAGFSAEWVRETIRNRPTRTAMLFDPFAGSGTALLAAQAEGVPSHGIENHPFVHAIAAAKLDWSTDPLELQERATRVIERAAGCRLADTAPPALLAKCYTAEALDELERLRCAYTSLRRDDAADRLVWLAITAILRECSGVGTAQWQYVLPNKTKARVARPLDAFQRRIAMFIEDIVPRESSPVTNATIHLGDARASSSPPTDQLYDLVITSPPYPNNYDYADSTRLEMTFWREVTSWRDLHAVVRHRLVRSCSQHSAADRLELEALIANPAVSPIRDELAVACRELEAIRLLKGGKKTYHTMVAAYFCDMAATWQSLRATCSSNAEVCFVIGDSAPYGVHIPVERWLATLAVSSGFNAPQFTKVRDRNIKWKNRKHSVPLQEGHLWLRG